ncbi:MAG: hypothetical protein Q9P14_10495 [candidate division KSB1 bacterium]|nr:hypothetical protein [candidate division KSB1 bacterium]
MVVHPVLDRGDPADLHPEIDIFWQRKLAENPALFNGRLAALVNAVQRNRQLELTLGITSYRYLLFSNAHAEAWRSSGQQHRLSRALGISAVVETADDRMLLMQRSQTVGEYPDRLDVFGGHIDIPEQPSASHPPDVVLAIREELRHELGITAAAIRHECCIGLAENSHNCKPELIFWTRLHLDTEAVRQSAREATEADEYVQLLAIPLRDLETGWFAENRRRLTPSAEASLALYFEFHRRYRQEFM